MSVRNDPQTAALVKLIDRMAEVIRYGLLMGLGNRLNPEELEDIRDLLRQAKNLR